MTHQVPERDIKEKIFSENPVPSNIKGRPGINGINTCIKELLIENKKTQTLNHEDSLRSIHEKIVHVSGQLLKLWTVMEEENRWLWRIPKWEIIPH